MAEQDHQMELVQNLIKQKIGDLVVENAMMRVENMRLREELAAIQQSQSEKMDGNLKGIKVS